MEEHLIQYIESIGSILKARAELSGRTKCTAYDLEEILPALSKKSSRIRNGSLQSGQELLQYIENRTIQPIQVVRVSEESTVIKSLNQSNVLKSHMPQDMPEQLPPHVPDHVIEYPVRHLYKQSAIYTAREQDPGKVREQSTSQTINLQMNLKKLVQKTDHSVVDYFKKGPVQGELPVINYIPL